MVLAQISFLGSLKAKFSLLETHSFDRSIEDSLLDLAREERELGGTIIAIVPDYEKEAKSADLEINDAMKAALDVYRSVMLDL